MAAIYIPLWLFISHLQYKMGSQRLYKRKGHTPTFSGGKTLSGNADAWPKSYLKSLKKPFWWMAFVSTFLYCASLYMPRALLQASKALKPFNEGPCSCLWIYLINLPLTGPLVAGNETRISGSETTANEQTSGSCCWLRWDHLHRSHNYNVVFQVIFTLFFSIKKVKFCTLRK